MASDTLGAIVGSIAEAIWDIPEWMKNEAKSYLPEEMRNVLSKFRHAVGRRRKESQEKEKLREFEAMMLWKLGCGKQGKLEGRTMAGR